MKSRYILAAMLALITSTSNVHAQTDERDVVRDSQGKVVSDGFGGCVRTKWVGGDEACRAVVPNNSSTRRSSAIGAEERTVYFDFDKSNLRGDAKRRLDTLANNLKSDAQVREASIVGFADRMGDASYNERLSKARAESVRNYLTSQGFINSRVADTRWVGESQPEARCSDNLSRAEKIACLQKDRKVEIEIEYKPE